MLLVKWVFVMVYAKNYETVSTFFKVMQKKPWPLFYRTRCIAYLDFWNSIVSSLSSEARSQLSEDTDVDGNIVQLLKIRIRSFWRCEWARLCLHAKSFVRPSVCLWRSGSDAQLAQWRLVTFFFCALQIPFMYVCNYVCRGWNTSKIINFTTD